MISALMLTTADRWWFSSLAIEQFVLQPGLAEGDELVVVIEEGSDPMPEAFGSSPLVRIVTIPPQPNLPAKRNLGVAACRNRWVAFWDDDDWHGRDRIECLKQAQGVSPASRIFGQHIYYQHELRTPRRYTYRYVYNKDRPDRAHSEPYVVGGTMMFDRMLWEKNPFVEENTRGDEGWWTCRRLRDDRVPYFVLQRGEYVAMIHDRNTCAREHRVDEHDFVMSDHFVSVVREANFLEQECGLTPAWLRRFEAAAWAELDRDRG
jgi:glycosyltransferase involved in cell wall biosynthesis